MKILIIEDDKEINEALKEGLEDESYAVDSCFDGEDGYHTAMAEEYDLIILDVMLPSMNGFEVCKKLRAEKNTTPILMLTARGQSQDVVRGLDFGADDYLPKPFNFDVLLAHMRAILRRPSRKLEEVLQVGDLVLNPSSKQVSRAGDEIKLTTKEYAVLEYLMRNEGKVLSKEKIISNVWDFDADVLPNNVELFIMFLRKKIDKPYKRKLIQTVPGFGYKIVGGK
jgi:two component transcriptional regulator, winged helix family